MRNNEIPAAIAMVVSSTDVELRHEKPSRHPEQGRDPENKSYASLFPPPSAQLFQFYFQFSDTVVEGLREMGHNTLVSNTCTITSMMTENKAPSHSIRKTELIFRHVLPTSQPWRHLVEFPPTWRCPRYWRHMPFPEAMLKANWDGG